MPSKVPGLVLLVPSLACAMVAHAAPQWCAGTVEQVLFWANGDVMIRSTWRNDWTRLCNVKGEVGNIDTVTCSLWASYAEQAVEKQLPVMVYYLDISQQCSTLAAYYNSPAPSYFLVKKP